jgi:very-short-patch-repair endonuclease
MKTTSPQFASPLFQKVFTHPADTPSWPSKTTLNHARRLLWEKLRARKLQGHRFLKEQRVGPHGVDVDFMCPDLSLAVILAPFSPLPTNEKEAEKDLQIRAAGLSIKRIPVAEILEDVEFAAECLLITCSLVGE